MKTETAPAPVAVKKAAGKSAPAAKPAAVKTPAKPTKVYTPADLEAAQARLQKAKGKLSEAKVAATEAAFDAGKAIAKGPARDAQGKIESRQAFLSRASETVAGAAFPGAVLSPEAKKGNAVTVSRAFAGLAGFGLAAGVEGDGSLKASSRIGAGVTYRTFAAQYAGVKNPLLSTLAVSLAVADCILSVNSAAAKVEEITAALAKAA